MKLYNPKIVQNIMHVNAYKFQNHDPDAYFWMLELKLGMSGQRKQQNTFALKQKWNFTTKKTIPHSKGAKGGTNHVLPILKVDLLQKKKE